MEMLVGPLMKKALDDVAVVRGLDDQLEGLFRDYPDGTAGRTISGPTLTRDKQRQFETRRDLRTSGSKQTWRLMLESATADVIAEAEEKMLRARLVALAALAVSWIEAIDRRKDERRIEKKLRPSWWARLVERFRR